MSKNISKIILPFFLFIFIFGIYFFTSPGHTAYDYFTRLANAFIKGKYYLEENPAWLNELVPMGNSKYYVVYPPMPAIVSIPAILIFKNNFYQEYTSYILGSLIPVIFFYISRKYSKYFIFNLWVFLLVGIGNILWFLASVGSSWYLGQVTSVFFLSLALYESLNKKRGFILGLFLGASYLSRIDTILTAPLFIYLISSTKKEFIKNTITTALGILPFFAFNSAYNFIRYSSIFDKGYVMIPGLFEEPWYKKGLFHYSNIPNHLRVMFLSLPKKIDHFPYIIPSWGGLSIFITTPAFVFALVKNKLKDKEAQVSIIAIILISLVIFTHGGTGFTQFGYRYAVDFYPFLYLLTLKNVAKLKSLKLPYILLFLSILVNLWGVIWINKFGWVEF